ncbi:hypothetical protein BKA14_004618 [Actinoplanes abujensis]|uniref:Uncharacterized protein n=1 Tax=Paractinoplanes abujensis TaxID=882441 RepID=A0A7W7CTL9_9ACTN|nr:hypothetical protein [Actinoplanes abujensis]
MPSNVSCLIGPDREKAECGSLKIEGFRVRDG